MALEFPVGTCFHCGVRGPLYVEDVDVKLVDETSEGQIQIIVCPECNTVLNSRDDVEVEWFDIEDAKYFGYKVVEDEL